MIFPYLLHRFIALIFIPEWTKKLCSTLMLIKFFKVTKCLNIFCRHVPVFTAQHIVKLRGKIENLLPLSGGITLIGIKDLLCRNNRTFSG